jgi:hypothetical protein
VVKKGGEEIKKATGKNYVLNFLFAQRQIKHRIEWIVCYFFLNLNEIRQQKILVHAVSG